MTVKAPLLDGSSRRTAGGLELDNSVRSSRRPRGASGYGTHDAGSAGSLSSSWGQLRRSGRGADEGLARFHEWQPMRVQVEMAAPPRYVICARCEISLTSRAGRTKVNDKPAGRAGKGAGPSRQHQRPCRLKRRMCAGELASPPKGPTTGTSLTSRSALLRRPAAPWLKSPLASPRESIDFKCHFHRGGLPISPLIPR